MRVIVEFLGGEIAEQRLGGSDGDSLIGRLDYRLLVAGEVTERLSSTIKLTAGASYDDGVVELGIPSGYTGPWNHLGFTDCARDYFLRRIVSVAPGARPQMVITNSYFGIKAQCSFDVADD